MKNLALFILAMIVFIGCRDDKQVDVQSPVIQSISVNGTQGEEIEVSAFSEIDVDIVVTDNTDLNQLRVSIVADSETRPTPNTGDWAELEIINISGTSSNQSIMFTVPDSVSGHWKLKVDCTDDLGNLITSSTEITVVNPNAPVVTGSTIPAVNGEGVVQIAAGTNLSVSGVAVDTDNFVYLRAHLTTLSGNVLSTLDVLPVLNSPFGFSNATFDNAQSGHFRVVIEAKDQLGYIGKWGAFVNVQ